MSQGDTERLIVLLEARFDQFDKAMKAAEKSGTRTFQSMQAGAYKATTALERQVAATAAAMGKSLDAVFGQNVERANKSARDSAAAFKEFDRARASVDAVRAAVDPLYAASKRYEAAVRDLDRGLAAGVMTQREYDTALEQVGRAYLGAEQGAAVHGAGLGRLGNVSQATKAKIAGVGFQVQDVAVQMAAGASATQALSMQLPQLLSGFGLVGIALGTLAAVGIPALGAAFGSGEGAARSFDDAMGAVRNSVQAVNDIANRYTAEGMAAMVEKYGELTAEVREFLELQRQSSIVQAMNDVRASVDAMMGSIDGMLTTQVDELAALFDVGAGGARRMLAIMDQIRDARTFDDQLAAVIELREWIVQLGGGIEGMTAEQFAFYQQVQDSEDALRQLAEAAPKAGWLQGAIDMAADLGGKLWDAVAAKLALADENYEGSPQAPQTSQRPRARGQGETIDLRNEGGGSSGGGRRSAGGGASGSSAMIESLIADLQTEREVVAAWYAESLAAINAATDAQLAAIGGRHEAIERLELEHQARLREAREAADNSALAHAGTFFGAMATLTAAGGAKLVKATRVFGAAEALANTFRAQSQVLADPTLGFWEKFPAVAAIGSAGFGLVSALGGGGGSGAANLRNRGVSGGASSAAASAAADVGNDPLSVIIQSMRGLDPKAIFQGQTLIDMTTAILKELGNRGIKVGAVS